MGFNQMSIKSTVMDWQDFDNWYIHNLLTPTSDQQKTSP